MTTARRLLLGLVMVVACSLAVFLTPTALAQTNSFNPKVEANPSAPSPAAPAEQDQSASEQTPQRTEDSAPTSPATSVQTTQDRTYEQPPNPYNMEAIEAYDEDVYGSGR